MRPLEPVRATRREAVIVRAQAIARRSERRQRVLAQLRRV